MSYKRFSFLTRIILALVFVVPVALQASPVEGVAPTREPVPYSEDDILGVCSFDVGITIPEWNVYLTTFYDQEGNVTKLVQSGQATMTLTNLSSGATLDLQISGPGQAFFNPDGSWHTQITGPWGAWYGELNDLLSFPPLALTTGNLSLQYDASGNLVDASYNGNVIDLCAVLGG